MEKKKVIVYVDGFNFYYGLKAKQWKKFYWLDIVKFFESMMSDNQELIEVHYFSARPLLEDKSRKQDAFFSANKLNPKFKLTLGRFLKKDITCRTCGSVIHSISLSNACDGQRKLSDYKARFNQAVLPSEITLPSGYVLKRPEGWE